MASPDVPSYTCLSDDQKNQILNKIEAVQNLLYLIRLDASDAGLVRAYVDQADEILEMQGRVMAEPEKLLQAPDTVLCGSLLTLTSILLRTAIGLPQTQYFAI